MKIFARILLIISIVLMLIGMMLSCKTVNKICEKDTIYVERHSIDTLIRVDSARVDSIENLLNKYKDSLKFYKDSIEYDSYINARRIEKIKYYISICEKKTSNKKFFYGWIKRVMTE
jgi:hypothetical protein